MFLAIVVGVVVADLVSWFSGAERDLSIQTGGDPFFPLDRGRLGQCLVLVVTVALSQMIVTYFDLPASATLVSVMVLTVVPDLHQLLRKGELRVLGVLLAMAYAFCSFVLLVRLQHFPLLVVLLFVGSYLATYLARSRRRLGLRGRADGARAADDPGGAGPRIRDDDGGHRSGWKAW